MDVMKTVAAVAAAAFLVTQPAQAGVADKAVDTAKDVLGDIGDALEDADEAISNWLPGSPLEKMFASVFGLTYLGEWWDGICQKVGGCTYEDSGRFWVGQHRDRR